MQCSILTANHRFQGKQEGLNYHPLACNNSYVSNAFKGLGNYSVSGLQFKPCRGHWNL